MSQIWRTKKAKKDRERGETLLGVSFGNGKTLFFEYIRSFTGRRRVVAWTPDWFLLLVSGTKCRKSQPSNQRQQRMKGYSLHRINATLSLVPDEKKSEGHMAATNQGTRSDRPGSPDETHKHPNVSHLFGLERIITTEID